MPAAAAHAYLGAAEGPPLLRARLPAGRHHRDAPLRRVAAPRRASRCRSIPPAMFWAARRSASRAADDVVVVSGDYKLAPDPTCAPFEPVRCDDVRHRVHVRPADLPLGASAATSSSRCSTGGRDNRATGHASVMFALCARQGAAHRSPGSCDADRCRADLPHGAIERINEAYREAGVALPPMQPVASCARGHRLARRAGRRAAVGAGLAVAAALRRLLATAFASGWMAIRGARAGARTSTAASRSPITPTGRR